MEKCRDEAEKQMEDTLDGNVIENPTDSLHCVLYEVYNLIIFKTLETDMRALSLLSR